MIITFVGHRTVLDYNGIFNKVYDILMEIASRYEHITFYCGGYGEFDELCACACRKLKIHFPTTEIVFITPYFSESQQQKIKYFYEMKLYDNTIYPELEKVPPKLAILKRNEWMVSHSDLIICYIKNTFGGAYKSYLYAKRKNKKTINIYES